jgi:hypothetical protein
LNVLRIPLVAHVSEWSVHEYQESGYSIAIPPNWQVIDIDIDKGKGARRVLLPPEKFIDLNDGQGGEISVDLLDNPKRMALLDFQKLSFENRYPESGIIGLRTIGDLDAIQFDVTSGEIKNTVVLIQVDEKIIQLTDHGERHKIDGIFDAIVNSIRASS